MAAIEQIGKYSIVRSLGHGGMGTVYLAHDPTLDRFLAIKVVRGDATFSELFERFLREARAAANLTHPNLVTVYEVGVAQDGRPFMAMEYIGGPSLSAVIDSQYELPLVLRLAYLDQLAAGLHVVHRAGIVHRDIKPANLMIDEGGRLRILDFGIAHVDGSMMTQDGSSLGTLGYMAPEQFAGRPADNRSDIFAMGVVAFELITGTRAFPNLQRHALPVLRDVVDTVPPGLDEWLARATHEDPNQRFADIDEARKALRTVRRALDPELDQEPPPLDERFIRREPPLSEEFLTAERTRLRESASWTPAAGVSSTLVVNPLPLGGETVAIPETRVVIDRTAVPPGPSPLTSATPARRQESGRRWGLVIAAAAAAVVVLIAVAVTMWPASEPRATVATAPDTTSQPEPSQVQTGDVGNTQATNERQNQGVASGRPESSTNAVSVSGGTLPTGPGTADPGPAKSEVTPLAASSASDMFYTKTHDLHRPATTPSTSPEFGATVTPTGLHYRILQKMANGTFVSVDPATPFRAGDDLRLSFESNIDGYLYILHQGTSGKWAPLFPAADMNNGSSRIRAFTQLQIPTDNDETFTLDDTPGTERLFVYLSKTPLGAPTPEQQNRPVPEGVLLAQASPDDFPQIRTRDLVRTSLKRTAGAPATSPDGTFIVNAQNGAAVMELIALVHK